MLARRTSVISLALAFMLAIGPAFATKMIINPYSRPDTCNSTAKTFLTTLTDTADSTTYTFPAVSIGNPPCAGNSRIIYGQAACFSVTTTSTMTWSVGGVAFSSDQSLAATLRSQIGRATLNTNSTTADVVLTMSGAADNTCERVAILLYVVISQSTTPIDQLFDSSATGDFDVGTNLATQNGGAIIWSIASQPASACNFGTWSGTETVTEDSDTAVEAAMQIAGYSTTANSDSTSLDAANISCGTETAGMAGGTTWDNPI